MVVQDSSQDSLGQKTIEWVNGNPTRELNCRVTHFGTDWHAHRAWQKRPGNRAIIPGSVLHDGWYFMVGASDLVQCRGEGAVMLSHEIWAESFRWQSQPVQREPSFSQIFLQQNRQEFSGFALPENYLGISWTPPLYGMRYVVYQDTIQAMIAGPQDSLFAITHHKALGLPLERDFLANKTTETVKTHLKASGTRQWWKWGQEGWVGLEGCSQAPKCSLWVEKQYEVLKIFGRDGFFSLKNAI